jgi:hypothetical protein
MKCVTCLSSYELAFMRVLEKTISRKTMVFSHISGEPHAEVYLEK